MYIKINNFLNELQQPLYKGINYNKLLPGSQEINYIEKTCVCIINENDFVNHIDVIEITRQEYEDYRMNVINSKPKSINLLEEINNLKEENANINYVLMVGGLI